MGLVLGAGMDFVLGGGVGLIFLRTFLGMGMGLVLGAGMGFVLSVGIGFALGAGMSNLTLGAGSGLGVDPTLRIDLETGMGFVPLAYSITTSWVILPLHKPFQSLLQRALRDGSIFFRLK